MGAMQSSSAVREGSDQICSASDFLWRAFVPDPISYHAYRYCCQKMSTTIYEVHSPSEQSFVMLLDVDVLSIRMAFVTSER